MVQSVRRLGTRLSSFVISLSGTGVTSLSGPQPPPPFCNLFTNVFIHIIQHFSHIIMKRYVLFMSPKTPVHHSLRRSKTGTSWMSEEIIWYVEDTPFDQIRPETSKWTIYWTDDRLWSFRQIREVSSQKSWYFTLSLWLGYPDNTSNLLP